MAINNLNNGDTGLVDRGIINALVDKANLDTFNFIIMRDPSPPFHRFKIVIDGTGMLVLPGEDLGV